MNSSSSTLVAPTGCPGWCDREACICDEDGTTQCSAPTVVQVGDEQWVLRLTHTTYRDDPEPGAVKALVATTRWEEARGAGRHVGPLG